VRNIDNGPPLILWNQRAQGISELIDLMLGPFPLFQHMRSLNTEANFLIEIMKMGIP